VACLLVACLLVACLLVALPACCLLAGNVTQPSGGLATCL